MTDIILASDFPVAHVNDHAGEDTQTFPQYLLRIGSPVPAVGTRVAVVLADTLAHARYAAKAAVLTYAKQTATTATAAAAATTATAATTAATAAAAAEEAKQQGQQGQKLSREQFQGAVARLQRSGHAKRAGLRLAELEEATKEAHAKMLEEKAVQGAEEAVKASEEAPHWMVMTGRPPAEWQRQAVAEGGTAAQPLESGLHPV